MTAEELNEFITDTGVELVVADLVSRGYYVKLLATAPVVAEAHLVRGDIRMLDACGMPLSGARVHIQTLRLPVEIVDANGDTFHIGDSTGVHHLELNADGVVRVPLIKGARVVITVDGGFSREILVPDVDFDVLSYATEEDSFIKPALPVSTEIRRA
jgi:hypothetical protein